jgi:outer membrane protein TolC
VIGLSTTLPIFNRNQGPIAEAEARRKEAAASFVEKQAQVIAGVERALALYTAALKELAEVDQTLRKLQDAQLRMMEQAVRLGEEDRLSLNGVQVQSSLMAQARLDALRRAQGALGELEDAVQRPLDPGDTFSISPESPALSKLSKESNR